MVSTANLHPYATELGVEGVLTLCGGEPVPSEVVGRCKLHPGLKAPGFKF